MINQLLFADDGPYYLKGIQRMPLRKKDQWQSSFAGSVEKEIAKIQMREEAGQYAATITMNHHKRRD